MTLHAPDPALAGWLAYLRPAFPEAANLESLRLRPGFIETDLRNLPVLDTARAEVTLHAEGALRAEVRRVLKKWLGWKPLPRAVWGRLPVVRALETPVAPPVPWRFTAVAVAAGRVTVELER